MLTPPHEDPVRFPGGFSAQNSSHLQQHQSDTLLNIIMIETVRGTMRHDEGLTHASALAKISNFAWMMSCFANDAGGKR